MTGREPLVDADCYVGAYGRTILLGVHGVAGVVHLRQVLDRLASAPTGTTVWLSEDPAVSVTATLGDIAFVVVGKPGRRRLYRDDRGGFTWVGTPYEWETASLLLEPLTEGCGHQYLTSEGDDDALVEVARDDAVSGSATGDG